MRSGAAFAAALLLFGPGAAPAAVLWNDINRQPAVWYAGDEARAVAAAVLLYQTPSGGWQKNTDMTKSPAPEALGEHEEPADVHVATIDNSATTTQLQFLARVVTATGDKTLTAAVYRGLEYLAVSQYPTGGWPQFFPLRKGYYTHITYNDNAMSNVLTLLREVAAGREPFAFVDEPHRTRAAAAVSRGISCLLRTQVKQDGKLTVWCAQHDETTLAPAWARNFEPPSLSGSESVGLVKLLMTVDNPGPETIAAIEGAIHWFETVKISGLRVEDFTGLDGKKDRRVVADPAAPALWARFYELGTNKPIYIGRDRVIHYDFNEIERERRAGYGYLGDWPENLLKKDYPRWRKKHKLP